MAIGKGDYFWAKKIAECALGAGAILLAVAPIYGKTGLVSVGLFSCGFGIFFGVFIDNRLRRRLAEEREENRERLDSIQKQLDISRDMFLQETQTSLARKNKEEAIRRQLIFLIDHFFGGSPEYRATILVPDDQHEHISPRYRYKFGESPRERLDSRAQFKKGVALAGFAWQSPHIPFKKNNIPEFSENGEFIRYYINQFKMPEELVTRLSPYMKNVRSIFCYGLCNHRNEFSGVLSIDSTDPAGFDNLGNAEIKEFLGVIEGLIEEL